MDGFKITVEDKPEPALRDTIVSQLEAYNWTKVERPTIEPLAVALRASESNEVIGGLWGASFGGWFFIEALFVPDALRGCGTGTSLVKLAEQVAIKRQCAGIWLDTFTFQAPAFYEKLGYQLMGKFANFPIGHDRLYYFKRLTTVDLPRVSDES